MEPLLIYFAIGGCTGWLLGWAMGRDVPRVIKYIIFGGIGGLAGGFLIDMIKDLAPMAGSALGALVLLAFLRKKIINRLFNYFGIMNSSLVNPVILEMVFIK